MNKIHPTAFASGKAGFLLLALCLWNAGCKKIDEHVKTLQPYTQVNLVANNNEYRTPAHEDPTLLNAWGLAFNPNGIPWVASQAGHVSQVYNSEGETLRPPVHIPSPGSTEGGGNPTGVVFNADSTAFLIPSGNGAKPAAARFIFAGVDGVVSGWNGAQGDKAYRVASTTGVYTGLTLARKGDNTYLYGANFKDARIDVWNSKWQKTSWTLTDPYLPAGYAPFNIQVIGDKLYVMYAKAGTGGEEEKGKGLGLVSVFETNGKFVKRLATGGTLNAPWGLAFTKATADNLFQDVIWVGNFGDGRINAYRENDGKFLGQLRKSNGNPIVIEGLWALMYPPATSTIDPNRLYFTAGPDDEQDGLFGYLIPDMNSHVN
ncbi:MAG TPA: TIGR03118 family protein [Chitinophagaceae bacterium]|nr:TIGR03118 family protein [Chitinophagaceae bacterium]